MDGEHEQKDFGIPAPESEEERIYIEQQREKLRPLLQIFANNVLNAKDFDDLACKIEVTLDWFAYVAAATFKDGAQHSRDVLMEDYQARIEALAAAEAVDALRKCGRRLN